MNTKFLFAKLAGLAVLIAALFVAVPVVRQRLMPKPATPITPPAIAPVQQQIISPAPKPRAVAKAVLPSPSPDPSPVAVPVTAVTPSADQTADAPSPSQPEPPIQEAAIWHTESGVRVVTFHVLPGQELDLVDPEFNFVKVESDYPLAIRAGKCQSTETQHWQCNNIPRGGLIYMQDLRVGVPADAPVDNVKVTAVRN
jgi:hypothetical protein